MTNGLLLISKSFNELLCLVLFLLRNSKKNKVLLRRIVDIKVTTTVKNKQEKAFQILNWLEHPLEGTIQSMLHAYVHIFSPKSRASKLIVHVSEKIDWSNFEDIAVSDDLVNYYKDLHDSPQKDENDNKLQWLKMQITLEAMKYVAKECITE
ncbi:hypothetical protein RFI_34023, partial [Reticulomyxa filosa]